jgi:hypothetical protein
MFFLSSRIHPKIYQTPGVVVDPISACGIISTIISCVRCASKTEADVNAVAVDVADATGGTGASSSTSAKTTAAAQGALLDAKPSVDLEISDSCNCCWGRSKKSSSSKSGKNSISDSSSSSSVSEPRASKASKKKAIKKTIVPEIKLTPADQPAKEEKGKEIEAEDIQKTLTDSHKLSLMQRFSDLFKRTHSENPRNSAELKREYTAFLESQIRDLQDKLERVELEEKSEVNATGE